MFRAFRYILGAGLGIITLATLAMFVAAMSGNPADPAADLTAGRVGFGILSIVFFAATWLVWPKAKSSSPRSKRSQPQKSVEPSLEVESVPEPSEQLARPMLANLGISIALEPPKNRFGRFEQDDGSWTDFAERDYENALRSLRSRLQQCAKIGAGLEAAVARSATRPTPFPVNEFSLAKAFAQIHPTDPEELEEFIGRIQFERERDAIKADQLVHDYRTAFDTMCMELAWIETHTDRFAPV